jgi:hypothetical protein
LAKNTFITAVGTAFWPKIAEKDREYDNYNTGLILDDKAFATFKKAVEEFMDGLKFPKLAKGKKPTVPYQAPGEHSGGDGWLIRAKSNYQPLIFDSKNKKVYDSRDNDPEDCPRIGGGSKLRLLVEFNAHEKGVNLYLKQIQVIELREYGGGSAFDEYEGGYEGDEEESFGDTTEETSTANEYLDI